MITQVDIAYYFKMLFFIIFNYYISIRILNIREYWKFKYKLIFLFSGILIALFCNSILSIFDRSIIICIIALTSIVYSVVTRNKIGYAILINAISISINLIMMYMATIISYIPHMIFNIDNIYLDLIVLIVIYLIMVNIFVNIKRIKNGIAVLKRNKENDYFNMMILNISWVVIFLTIILVYCRREIANQFVIGLIIFSILMFITIQKSLQLYYKQKMLVKDLEETKEELENKKMEVEALEKENLEFSKVSHSIAHKQKALEYKLNELSMKSEIAEEMDLKDRIENLNKDLRKETVVVLHKTGISEIDDMLSYMQSECVKNKIDFQLQLSGNIYKMINNYIEKEELEILLADHIKNSIIAIGYGDNINKSVLVRLGKLDGSYGFYVYDSGIEFEIETLLNLGKKSSTTHKESGGTGMGFMNTFDTLRRHEASFIIEEYGKPVKDNFTKALKFKFDRKNEFKICSYREDKIKDKDSENNLIVEKLYF